VSNVTTKPPTRKAPSRRIPDRLAALRVADALVTLVPEARGNELADWFDEQERYYRGMAHHGNAPEGAASWMADLCNALGDIARIAAAVNIREFERKTEMLAVSPVPLQPLRTYRPVPDDVEPIDQCPRSR
jgi:hypothetical protein